MKISVSKEVTKNEEGEKYRRREFSYTNFERSFQLPDSIDQGSIEAKYDNGVLNVHLPKKEEAKVQPNRTIEIG